MPEGDHQQFGLASVHELEAVRELYRRNDYGGGLRPDDRVFVARSGTSISAAARLCQEFDSCVLRGMFVAEQLRGQGLGLQLLMWMAREIGPQDCWCVPYAHLVQFYSQVGFVQMRLSECPQFLIDRATGYEASGPPVVIMRRLP